MGGVAVGLDAGGVVGAGGEAGGPGGFWLRLAGRDPLAFLGFGGPGSGGVAVAVVALAEAVATGLLASPLAAAEADVICGCFVEGLAVKPGEAASPTSGAATFAPPLSQAMAATMPQVERINTARGAKRRLR